MNTYVFDAEFDGLTPTKIHCLGAANPEGKIFTTTSYSDMRKFLTRTDIKLVAHNGIRFDKPNLERLLGITITCQLIDTLPLSWYLYPDRMRHGLGDWGEEFGVPKPEVEDWVNLDIKEYIHRVTEDVRINVRLWEQELQALTELYGDDKGIDRLIHYLSFKMDCAALQEDSRWKLDVERCRKGLDQLLKEKEDKREILKGLMPQVPEYAKKTKPKKPYKQSGELSAHGERWFKLLQEQGLHPETTECQVLVKYNEPNPNSHQQVKDYLFSLGWRPDEFKYVKEDDGTTRKIPQINTQIPGEDGVTQSVKQLIEKVPELEALDGLYVISHRISILEGFLNNMDADGYVKAEIQGLTNTLRFKHKTIVNLPKPGVPYGELIRGCLIAPDDGYELCGSDMSGLEDRTKQHFMWPYDPEYVKTMMADDYDPHLTLAVFAGALTPEQEAQYKEKDCPHDVKVMIKAIRHVYKTTVYSATYGAGGPRIAQAAGVPVAKGYELHEAYWGLNWSIKAIVEDTKTKMCLGGWWLFNPVSKLWYSLRHPKDTFSTLNQGTGVWCFDTWIKYVLQRRRQITGQFHDEGVWTIRKGQRDEFSKILMDALKDTNEELKLNRELDIDIQYGDTYAAIH